jgi:hypothetical protein
MIKELETAYSEPEPAQQPLKKPEVAQQLKKPEAVPPLLKKPEAAKHPITVPVYKPVEIKDADIIHIDDMEKRPLKRKQPKVKTAMPAEQKKPKVKTAEAMPTEQEKPVEAAPKEAEKAGEDENGTLHVGLYYSKWVKPDAEGNKILKHVLLNSVDI